MQITMEQFAMCLDNKKVEYIKTNWPNGFEVTEDNCAALLAAFTKEVGVMLLERFWPGGLTEFNKAVDDAHLAYNTNKNTMTNAVPVYYRSVGKAMSEIINRLSGGSFDIMESIRQAATS
jgi:hypothetical protein